MSDIIVLNRDVTEFVKTLSGLGVVKVSGSAKYITKLRDQAIEALALHFNIE